MRSRIFAFITVITFVIASFSTGAGAYVQTKKKTTTAKKVASKKVASKKRVRKLPPVDPTVGDDVNGEDLVVRQAAVDALGPRDGTVVVVNPNSGRVLSMVNQKLALSSGEQPCSTIKLPVALAALSEGLITRDTKVKLTRRQSMSLVQALAHSNNRFFEELGKRMGFEKWSQYANQFGFGELAGYHIPGEQLGTIPEQPPAFGGVARMSSFGEQVSVTPLQLAAFVSAVGNGGTLYYMQYPKTPEELEGFQPRVKRQLNVQSQLGDLREGMMAVVDYGTGHRAAQPFDAVLGKTGTCSHGGTHLRWFASYQGSEEARLAVVVLLRSTRNFGSDHATDVAGRVYKNLHERNYSALGPALASPAVAATENSSQVQLSPHP